MYPRKPSSIDGMLLAHLVVSLCNYALSGLCLCHWHHLCPCPCLCLHPHPRYLCTAVPVIALIIETSYLTNICIYSPSICTYIILLLWCIFWKWWPFYQISFCGCSVYKVKLRAFIFGSVMHLYWRYIQERNYATTDYILKIMNF